MVALYVCAYLSSDGNVSIGTEENVSRSELGKDLDDGQWEITESSMST